MITRATHALMDRVMCAMMNVSQWRLRHHAVSRERLEEYLDRCSLLDHRSYYAIPSDDKVVWRRDGNILSWNSPLPGIYPENNIARAKLYPAQNSQGAPTIILLHALMSANDLGYRRIARQFNQKGWNVLFPHLPYHYSRRPKGYVNGALAITSDLVRNAEGLRQSVIELRQLITWARQRGSSRVAILATSYGAWVAALALAQEMTDFTILLQPVADVTHATFESPASQMMAGLLKRNDINRELIARHAHLSSPLHMSPLTPPERITVIGGKHDRLSPSESMKALCKTWGGARYLEVDQGHFGYEAMRCALKEADRFLNAAGKCPV
jgi:pimeloyl-ACP methyl ester carboxylesterase